MPENRTVILAAGGTGGHIAPALGIAEALEEIDPNLQIVFIGIGNNIENRMLEGTPYRREVVPFKPAKGVGVFGIFKMLSSFPLAIFFCRRLFKRISPSVVIGFGGYPSFVPVITAALMGIPRAVQEQNVQAGLANKIISLFANNIYAVTGSKGLCQLKKIFYLPNPVRKKFQSISESQLKKEKQLNVFVVGGSQGAVTLNNAILNCLDVIAAKNIHLIHQTGAANFDEVKAKYSAKKFADVEILPFTSEIEKYYQKADLIICRAGAMTVAEIAASGRPAIFVPLLIAGGHQKENASQLQKAGGCEIVEQNSDLAANLANRLIFFAENKQRLQEMAQNAKKYSISCGEPSATIIAQGIFNLSTIS